MKKYPAVLLFSLAANAGLVVAWLASREATKAASPAPVAAVRPAAAGVFSLSQLDALRTGDAAALGQAGVPPEVIRALLAGRAYARMRDRQGVIQRGLAGRQRAYWKSVPGMVTPEHSQAFRAMSRVQTDYMDELRALFGEDSTPWIWGNFAYAALPTAKRAQLQKIEQDYAEMQSAIYSETGGFFLASDQKKVELLNQEKRRDIEALLTAEELEQVDLRLSSSAQWVQQSIGAGIATEEEYRKIVALRKAFDERFVPGAAPNPSQEYWQQRSQAEAELGGQIRAVLGEEAYAQMRRMTDQEYQMLGNLERRLSLPAGTADNLYAARDRYAELSQAINGDGSLPADERRRLLQALGEKARNELAGTLGASGVADYAQRASWLQLLAGGTAFSTDLNRAPSVGSRSIVSPVAAKEASLEGPPKG